jgi:hypothetical protein
MSGQGREALTPDEWGTVEEFVRERIVESVAQITLADRLLMAKLVALAAREEPVS